MKSFNKNTLIWLVVIFGLIFFFNYSQINNSAKNSTEISYSQFLTLVENKEVSDIVITGSDISGKLANGFAFNTYSPNDSDLVSRLKDNGISFSANAPNNSPSILGIFISWFPMLLLIGVWIFLFRQMQSGGGKVMGFGRSKAKLIGEDNIKTTFKDVAGVEEAKEELSEIVNFLKNSEKFQKLGGKIPRGVLLVGAPGTGKTLLARAIAGEAKVPFFTISGSDFVEMFVGVGASRVRDMFLHAKKNSPCIIFIDEIDAVGRHRGAGLGNGNDEREQTLNQLLVEMDGFDNTESIILIAATNRPDVLDPALLRPGRFDRQVVVPVPDVTGRAKILQVHLKNIPQSPDVDPMIIARGTPGFTGADLANLINEAALHAAKENKKMVFMTDLEIAKDKVMMGAERRSMVMSDEEKELTAYHEAGHALATIYCKESDPIHKATIIPRGRSLGMVMRLPKKDYLSLPYDKLMENMVVGMGGRIAEEMIFGKKKITTGAAADIKMVTNIARRMVTEWGMSDKLGALLYSENQDEVFLGHSIARQQNISEKTSAIIDQEIKRIVDECDVSCRKILSKHKKELILIAKALLKYETLDGKEVTLAAKGKSIDSYRKKNETARTKPRRKIFSEIGNKPQVA